MLLELHIAGLGVIEDVTLELSPGLNVLTGETGAGKTMITVGLALALGGRGHSGLARRGSPRARVEARFDASDSQSAREWAEDGDLVLSRAISGDGRSTARAGGQLCPVSTLAELGRDLVEVHGQHQTQGLLHPAAQLSFLDRYAGRPHVETLERYRRIHGRLLRVRASIERLDAEAREREREKDLLGYQVREIEAAALSTGEVARLEAEAARLTHAERIRERLSEAVLALGGEAGGGDALRTAAAAVADAASLAPGMSAVSDRMASLVAEVDDTREAIRAIAETIEMDPRRLETVRERLAGIRALERKYGDGEAGILGYLEEARRRLGSVEAAGAERAALDREARALEAEAERLAAAVSRSRAEAAPQLSAALRDELVALGMEGSSVEVRLVDEHDLGPDGRESSVLLFSGGPGQEPAPLGKVASGGELSRTMLACRTVLADLDRVSTLVFDEVDAGIGGRAGVAVGRRLAALARRRQILVVTHLPQIACFADRHFQVTKERGVARVRALDGEERVGELARMLSGMPTDDAASHAVELLAEAARQKA